MKDKITLILGASGLIGNYLYDFLKQKGGGVIGTYNQNKRQGLIPFDLIKSSVDDLPIDNIDYAVICSAITKLDKCKNNPKYSRLVNVKGIEKIVKGVSKRDVVPVFMSSASVFDGIKGGYKEDDEKNPISVYGEQKKEVEDFITNNFNDYLIIRPGKVFGIKKREGVLFADWLWKYKNKETIYCADDEKLSPNYAGDVAKGINLLLEKDARGVFHVNPQEHYSRFEMATLFFNYLGIKDAKIIKCSIDDFDFSEKRAKNTYLDSSKFIGETRFKFTPLEKCFEMIMDNN